MYARTQICLYFYVKTKRFELSVISATNKEFPSQNSVICI